MMATTIMIRSCSTRRLSSMKVLLVVALSILLVVVVGTANANQTAQGEDDELFSFITSSLEPRRRELHQTACVSMILFAVEEDPIIKERPSSCECENNNELAVCEIKNMCLQVPSKVTSSTSSSSLSTQEEAESVSRAGGGGDEVSQDDENVMIVLDGGTYKTTMKKLKEVDDEDGDRGSVSGGGHSGEEGEGEGIVHMNTCYTYPTNHEEFGGDEVCVTMIYDTSTSTRTCSNVTINQEVCTSCKSCNIPFAGLDGGNTNDDVISASSTSIFFDCTNIGYGSNTLGGEEDGVYDIDGGECTTDNAAGYIVQFLQNQELCSRSANSNGGGGSSSSGGNGRHLRTSSTIMTLGATVAMMMIMTFLFSLSL